MARFVTGIDKQLIPVRFSGGVDTKSPDQLIMPGKFRTLQNCVRRKTDRVEKRYGFTALGQTVVGTGTTISSGNRLSTFVNDLVLLSDSKIYSYAAASNAWIDKGTIATAQISASAIIRNSDIQAMPDSVSYQGITATVWEDSRGGVRASLIDEASGAPLLSDTLLSSTGVRPHVVAIKNYFLLCYIDTSDSTLRLQRVAVVNPSILLTEQILAGNVSNKPWSITSFNGAAFFAFNSTATNIRYGYVAWTGLIGSPGTNGYPAIQTLGNPGRDALTVSAGESSKAYITYTDANIHQVRLFSVSADFTANDDSLIEDSIDTCRNVGACVRSGGDIRIFYEVSDASVKNHYIKHVVASWSGSGTATIGTPAVLTRSVGMVSIPFAVDTNEYVMAAHDSTLQPTYFVIRQDGVIVAKILPGTGGGLNRDTSRTLKTGLWRPSTDQDGNIIVLANIRTQLTAANDGTVLSSHVGVNRIALNFTSVVFDSDTLGNNFHISGGIVRAYDGVSAPEHGFHVFPEDVTGSVASGTATFPSVGQYSYKVIYEWVDGKGQIHRSAPSVALSKTISNTTDQISLVIPKLRITEKTGVRGPVRIVIYRTEVDLASVYYRLRTIANDNSSENNVVKDDNTATYTDDNSDATSLVNREILYTTGGVLENIAPPACKAIVKHRNRIFLAGLEDGTTIQYSRERVFGEGVAFSDALTITADPLGGDVSALGSLDEKLILFKNSRTFYVSGQGPTDAGTNNDYTEPQLISADVGCSNPRSIVITPLGIIFKSNKGFYLLSRALETAYIGADVEDFNSLNVTSAVLMEDVNEVRFTTSDGVTLVYNYFFNQWSTFSNYQAESATTWSDSYIHLKSTGQVNQEIAGQYNDNGQRYSMLIETSWFSLAGLQGYQRLYWLSVLGEFKSHHISRIDIAYNFESFYTETRYFNTQRGLGTSTYGSSSPYGGESTYGSGSTVYQFRQKPMIQKCESFRVRLQDDDHISVSGGASFNLTALSLLVGTKAGTYRLPAGKTVGRV